MNRLETAGVCDECPSANEARESSGAEWSLPRLLEQAAKNVPEVDSSAYKTFYANVSRLAPQLSSPPIGSGDLELLRQVLEEFGQYHKCTENALRERLAAWRRLVTKLLLELFARSGVAPTSADAAPLAQSATTLLSSAEIHAFTILLDDFLRLNRANSSAGSNAPLARESEAPTPDNNNAAGLHSVDAAVAQLKTILDQGERGFIVHFQLCCLGMINERFGEEAVYDSMMAVSAFLTRSLRSEDTVYYWNDSSLLAILPTPATERVITMAIQRIVDNNRDITLSIGGRVTMLRIPLKFEISPIDKLRAAEDLYKLSSLSTQQKRKR
jgi:GGDEF domain-containing protein